MATPAHLTACCDDTEGFEAVPIFRCKIYKKYSEIGEPGISFWTDDGVYLEIGQSEIDTIEILR